MSAAEALVGLRGYTHLSSHMHMSRDMRFPTMWYVRQANDSDQPAHTRSLIRAIASRLNIP